MLRFQLFLFTHSEPRTRNSSFESNSNGISFEYLVVMPMDILLFASPGHQTLLCEFKWLYITTKCFNGPCNFYFCNRGTVKKHKAPAAGAGYFSTGGAMLKRFGINRIDKRIGDAAGHRLFIFPAKVQDLANAFQLSAQ